VTNDAQGLDLLRGLAMLKRNALLALVLFAGGGGAGYALASAQPVEHTATAKVLVGSTAAGNYQEALDGTVLSSRLLTSYAGLIKTQPLVNAVANAVSADTGLTAAQIKDKLSARSETKTLLLDIFATDEDPAVARRLSDAAASALVSTIKDLDSDAAKIVTADVVDPAVAAAPSTQRTEIAGTVAGALLGFLLALVIGLVRAGRDRTVKRPEDAEAVFEAPLLGTIPAQPRKTRSPIVVTNSASAPAEAFREVRTALMLGENRPRTLLVTSPLEGDGKTVVAVNLAAAFAQAGEHVVLVDADLRRGRIGKRLRLATTTGVTSLLTNSDAALEDGLQRWNDLFDVVTSGPAVSNPAELLGSQAFRNLLDELASVADLVVIDAPPVIPVTDAVVLSAGVDGVLVVARQGATGRGLGAEARRRLTRVGADIRGVVLNDVSKSAARSYYSDYPVSVPASSIFAGARAVTD
jgi:capsular exopolysaccharide synthesis family protein